MTAEMKIFLSYVLVLGLLLGPVHCGDVSRLVRTLHALTRALHYMQENVQEINLDAVYCIRVVQEQLQAYLTYDVQEFRTFRLWIEVLRDRAKTTADLGRTLVTIKDPEYAAVVGNVMDESPPYVWHSSRNTSEQFVETRVKCLTPKDFFDETKSNLCFNEISGNDTTSRCRISAPCIELNSKPHQRDFALTHQMLFWRHMETHGCVDRAPEDLQQRLCSNIMRDAEWIASANFPESHRDLFMEQVGLCGFWGFRDFNKPEWTEKILEWQLDSGCYSGLGGYYCTDDLQPDPTIRVKRREKILSDNCLSHKTSVALLAIVSMLRFEAEKVFQATNKSQNTLNKLLV